MRTSLLTLSVLGLLSLPLVSQGQASGALTLSPLGNQKSGQMPSGVARLTFALRDGDWLEKLALPARPLHGQVVEIRNTARYTALLELAATELGPGQLEIRTGDVRRFVYDAGRSQWLATGDGVVEAAPEAMQRTASAYVRKVVLKDGAWAPEVALPAEGQEGEFIVVSSQATWPSLVRGGVLFNSTFRVEKGDQYTFVFSAAHGKWLPRAVPERTLPLQAAIPVPTSPRMRLRLHDGAWLRHVSLPASAGDRDRIVVESTATWDSQVQVPGGEALGPLTLRAGDRYEFMYVADDARWVLMSHPERRLEARDLAGGRVPALTSPRTRIMLADGNWQRELVLPAPVAGAEIVIDIQATYPVDVILDGVRREKIERGERVTFAPGTDGRWQRTTSTLDLLALYSGKLAASIGESAARAHLVESLAITNDTLENSGANFRVRMVDIRRLDTPDSWALLADALSQIRDEKRVQAWRDETRADMVYYLGTETGCGLAFSRASNENAYATEAFGQCGSTVMRHELGHVIALNHVNATAYWKGYPLAQTVMNGNAIPLYSTPLRFTPDLGIRAGIADEYDAVRALNERSPIVAAYR